MSFCKNRRFFIIFHFLKKKTRFFGKNVWMPGEFSLFQETVKPKSCLHKWTLRPSFLMKLTTFDGLPLLRFLLFTKGWFLTRIEMPLVFLHQISTNLSVFRRIYSLRPDLYNRCVLHTKNTHHSQVCFHRNHSLLLKCRINFTRLSLIGQQNKLWKLHLFEAAPYPIFIKSKWNTTRNVESPCLEAIRLEISKISKIECHGKTL